MDQQARSRMIQEHLDAIRDLQAQEAQTASGAGAAASQWPPRGFYWLFHILVGMLIGMVGATVSLAANAIGAPLFDEDPLKLIRVYLTFPMGEAALTAESGKVIFVGCVLYLVTGGLFGIVFHLIMAWYFRQTELVTKIIFASLFGLGLWVVNYYLILSWLQPALLGGNWIITEVPVWVAALTHLALAWTMLVVEVWGEFEPISPAKAAAAPA